MQSSDKINYLSELLTCAGAPPEDAKRVLSAFTTPADIASAGQDILKNISGCSLNTEGLNRRKRERKAKRQSTCRAATPLQAKPDPHS